MSQLALSQPAASDPAPTDGRCGVMRDLEIIIGPSVEIDRRTFEELAGAVGRSLGRRITLHWCGHDQLGERVRFAPAWSLVVPGPTVDVSDIVGDDGDEGPPADATPVIRFDAEFRDRDRSPGVKHHLRGIGLDGLGWAIRACVHAAVQPPIVISYGDADQQFAHLRTAGDGPADPPAAGSDRGRPALAVLVHGGYWRSRWQLDLMDAAALDLVRRGIHAWNLEYRRPDVHGWETTVSDIHAGIRRAQRWQTAENSTAGPVVVIGHSAGGQLALQVAERLADEGHAPAAVMSLAGVVDLHAAHARGMGAGAVTTAMGGTPTDVPERYRDASAMGRSRRRIPVVVVQGHDDDADIIEMNRRFVAELRARDHTFAVVDLPGDHFDVIDPGTAIWRAGMTALSSLLR